MHFVEVFRMLNIYGHAANKITLGTLREKTFVNQWLGSVCSSMEIEKLLMIFSHFLTDDKPSHPE